MAAALAAIADHCDHALQGGSVGIGFGVDRFQRGFSFAQKKTPRSGWERGALGSWSCSGPLLRAWGRSPMWDGKYDNKGKAVGDGRLRFLILNQRPFRLHDRPLIRESIGIPFLTFMLHRGMLFKPKMVLRGPFWALMCPNSASLPPDCIPNATGSPYADALLAVP